MHYRHPWVSLLCTVATLLPSAVTAQITPDPNGTGTQVTQTGQQFNISGGTPSRNGQNLFHLFREFSVNNGQTANFLSNSHIRNILAGVNGGNASYINGLIQVSGGNSNLYLMNPAGMVFGPNARLNVPAAFHASTASRVHFEGGVFDLFSASNDYANLLGNPTGFEFNSKGILINEGHLSVRDGQSLTLMAHQVINTGTLSAPGGTVTVQAVPETGMVRVSQEGMLLSLEVPQDRLRGEIAAVDLPSLLTGSTPEQRVNSVIQNADGTISLVHDPNKVSIPMAGATTVLGGTVEVANAAGMGGHVKVLGSHIALVGASINAAGETGGGTILVGGDYLGGTTGTNRLDASFNAQHLFVDAQSVMNANAIRQGNGGTVINWSDNSTVFHGTITARGGALGGDGGFVETSGRELLEASGTVDASAPLGRPGIWLLDPRNVTINATSTTNGSFSGGNPNVFTPNANNATVLNTTINTSLNGGTNVRITTGTTGFQAGNITVNAPISKTTGGEATLTLAAANNIVVNANITSTSSKLNIVLNANVDSLLGGAIIVSGATLNSNGGNITLEGGSSPSITPAIGSVGNNSGILLDNAQLNSGEGNISLIGQGRDTVAANSYGIRIINNSTLETTSGNISLIGEGGDRLLGSITDNSGISISGSQILSNSGLISLDGIGGSSPIGANNAGVTLTNSTITNTMGNILIEGEGGSALLGTLDNNTGIIVSGSIIQNEQRHIELSGTGGNSLIGASNIGISIINNSEIKNIDGNIDICGSGGDSLTNLITNSDGVSIAESKVTNTNGRIHILGTGGDSILGSNNVGLRFFDSTLSNDTGEIQLEGSGGLSLTGNIGIFQGNTTVETTSGNINYIGTGTNEADGIRTETGSNLIGNGTTGNINLTADRMSLNDLSISGTGNSSLTIQPLTANIPIGLNSVSGTLNLSTAELNTIQDGFSLITIGRTDGSGAITVGGHTFSDSLRLRNPDGGGIAIDGALSVGTSNNLTLHSGGAVSQTQSLAANGLELLGSGSFTLTNPSNDITTLAGNTTGVISFRDANGFAIGTVNTVGLSSDNTIHLDALSGVLTLDSNTPLNSTGGSITLQAGQDIIGNSGSSITTQGGAIILNSDRDATNGGAIRLTGTTVTSNGGDITLGGGNDPANTPAIGTVSSVHGIRLNRTDLTAGGGNIRLHGQGLSDDNSNYGISQVDGAQVRTTGTGTITYTGTGGNGINTNYGILLLGTNTSIISANGEIRLTGTGQGTGVSNFGISQVDGAQVRTTGSGAITYTGTGGNGSNDNYGILLSDTSITSTDGAISLTGAGGQGTGVSNFGIFQRDGAQVTSTRGNITYTGTGANSAEGIRTEIGSNLIGNGTTGNINLTADRMRLNDLSISGTGNLTIQPLTPNTSIGLNSGSGTLNLDTTELNTIQDGFRLITIGRTDGSGAITVGGHTFSDSLRLRNPDGGGIAIDGALSVGTSNNLTLHSGGAVTQTQPIVAQGLAILGTGNTELTHPNNQIQTLAANTTGNLTVVNNGTLTVDTVNPTGIEKANTVLLRTLSGDIVLNQPIIASGNITLAAAQNFINNVGSAPLVVGAGNRWLVYATSPQGNVNGWSVMGGSQAFGLSYPQSPPFSGSGFVYTSAAPPTPPIPPEPINPVTPPQPLNPVIPPQPVIPVPPDDPSFEGELGREFFGQEPADSIVAEGLCEFAGEEQIINLEALANPELIFLPECS
ncbi:filamentous hemagglutinin N-terminal domain-containing protein [Thermosynechococcaceae cyanobacterium Okahandja]